jgi:hypothetical protein
MWWNRQMRFFEAHPDPWGCGGKSERQERFTHDPIAPAGEKRIVVPVLQVRDPMRVALEDQSALLENYL